MGKRGPIQLPRRDRFYVRVDQTGDCWLWQGAINHARGGYGYFYDDDTRLRRAHRVAYEIETGEVLPPEIHLLHHCDTPACVRPSHLFLGDQAINMADMRHKGRGHKFAGERGTDRYNAVLNDEKVRLLRNVRDAGGSVNEAARRMGVSSNTAHRAASRQSWQHVV